MKIITKAEVDFCMYKLDMSGDFKTKLYDLYWLANTFNKSQLISIFPNLKVTKRFSEEEDYWPNLVKRWNSQNTHLKLYE